jgi:alkanesulfonate monooxygenase SsuD/methylene tetrahydromethanopterin reductase-like flavin-dependent oxidoreductase (luciferase family)
LHPLSSRRPYAAACVNVIAADSDAEAERVATSFYQFALSIIRGGASRPLQAPIESMGGAWNDFEEEAVRSMMTYSFVGGPEKVRQGLERFVQQTQVSELLAVSHIFDHAARLRSYELLAAGRPSAV